MIFVDTNVLAELMRPEPDARVLGWMDGLRRYDIGLTAISIAEILYGIGSLPEGKKKHRLSEAAAMMFDQYFSGRVYAFDRLAAIEYADRVLKGERMGLPISVPPAQIAVICRVCGAQVATRNTRDIEGIGLLLINPWEA
jgi:predicted nucleic acid-binding protein